MVFKSEVSVSFRVIVEFFDSDGIAVCPVIVHATSENSLLTTHMYIRTPIIDFQWSLSIDKRVSRASKTSDSFTDDEEYEVNSYRPVREFSFYKNSYYAHYAHIANAWNLYILISETNVRTKNRHSHVFRSKESSID